MKKTFEHLLGLNARDALALLKSVGIFDVRVTFTSAPQPLHAQPDASFEEEALKPTALQGMAAQFEVSEDEETEDYDLLLEPVVTDGVLTEARVIGIRDDGRQLLVSRFKVGNPKPPKGNS